MTEAIIGKTTIVLGEDVKRVRGAKIWMRTSYSDGYRVTIEGPGNGYGSADAKTPQAAADGAVRVYKESVRRMVASAKRTLVFEEKDLERLIKDQEKRRAMYVRAVERAKLGIARAEKNAARCAETIKALK